MPVPLANRIENSVPGPVLKSRLFWSPSQNRAQKIEPVPVPVLLTGSRLVCVSRAFCLSLSLSSSLFCVFVWLSLSLSLSPHPPPSLDLSRRGKTNKMSALNASASTGMFRVVSSTGLCIHASSSSSSSSPTTAAPCGSHEQGCAFQPILVSIASSLPTVTRSAHFFSTRLSVSASSWISRSNRSTSKRR